MRLSVKNENYDFHSILKSLGPVAHTELMSSSGKSIVSFDVAAMTVNLRFSMETRYSSTMLHPKCNDLARSVIWTY
jgi:hypothetical protein